MIICRTEDLKGILFDHYKNSSPNSTSCNTWMVVGEQILQPLTSTHNSTGTHIHDKLYEYKFSNARRIKHRSA